MLDQPLTTYFVWRPDDSEASLLEIDLPVDMFPADVAAIACEADCEEVDPETFTWPVLYYVQIVDETSSATYAVQVTRELLPSFSGELLAKVTTPRPVLTTRPHAKAEDGTCWPGCLACWESLRNYSKMLKRPAMP